METWSFIGSDKNAGKTTALLAVARKLCRTRPGDVTVTSVGINGEAVDAYDQRPKPTIELSSGVRVLTAGEHLTPLAGRYRVRGVLGPPAFAKEYVLAELDTGAAVVVEGPNTGEELRLAKARLAAVSPGARLLVDGSIDRQFLGSPQLSDAFYFALLLSDRPLQRQKARDLVRALSLPCCTTWGPRALATVAEPGVRALLFDAGGEVAYRGTSLPALDLGLRQACAGLRREESCLYLNGALSPELFDALLPFRRLTVVLDNFTLLLHGSVGAPAPESAWQRFLPRLRLLWPVNVRGIFVHEEGPCDLVSQLPSRVPVLNLFRETPDAVVV